MKKIKITLTGMAFIIAIGAAFAFRTPERTTIKGTAWFQLNSDGSLHMPITQVNPNTCPNTGSTPCAGEYNTTNQGQPTGVEIDEVTKP